MCDGKPNFVYEKYIHSDSGNHFGLYTISTLTEDQQNLHHVFVSWSLKPILEISVQACYLAEYISKSSVGHDHVRASANMRPMPLFWAMWLLWINQIQGVDK